MVARLHAVYDSTATEDEREAQITQLSEELNRKVASIRAKLTREGVYVPKAKVASKAPAVRKAQLVTAIAAAMGEDEDVLGSLEKATKATLVRVLAAL